MSPQNIVPATGLADVSGSGLLIGSFDLGGAVRRCTDMTNDNCQQARLSALRRTSRSIELVPEFASEVYSIPFRLNDFASRNANISVNNV